MPTLDAATNGSHALHALRTPSATLSSTLAGWSDEDDLWGTIEPSIRRLKAHVRRIDHDAIRSGGASSEALEGFHNDFADCELILNEVLGDARGASDSAKASVGARVQAELLPYLLLGDNAERWYAKPRGYAGDYLTIARIYEDQPSGVGRVGPIVDRCFLNLAAVRAVQNRRAVLAREIRASIEGASGNGARVTSLACGPARELFDVYDELSDPMLLHSTLVDVDLHALAYVSDHCTARLRRRMTLVNANLVHIVTGRRPVNIAEQDLIYSVGLIDYFNDEFVVRLMNWAHASLKPGGRVLLGNFHPRNPTKAVMDHVLDWKLVHRTEDDMSRLLTTSAFGRPATRILYEDQRINLFAECVKV